MSIASIVRKLVGKPVSRRFEYDWIASRVPEGASVLDVGCVRGRGLQKLTYMLIGKLCTVYAVSLQPFNSVERGKLPKKKGPLIYIQGDILEEEFKTESFDAIIASHILQHLGLPYFGLHSNFVPFGDKAFVDKAWRWLKPEGKLFVVVPLADRFQFVSSSSYKYRVYSGSALAEMFAGKFSVIDGVAFDGAHDTKRRVEGAKALLWELEKIENSVEEK